MSVYELAVLGSPSPLERETLLGTIGKLVGDFGLALGTDVIVHDGANIIDPVFPK